MFVFLLFFFILVFCVQISGMCGEMLEGVRAAYPRLFFVSDRLLLEALATGSADAASLPPALLDACFQGLQTLDVVNEEPPPASPVVQGLPLPPQQYTVMQSIVAVTGTSGETLELVQVGGVCRVQWVG